LGDDLVDWLAGAGRVGFGIFCPFDNFLSPDLVIAPEKT
jgi:hypothetical protein